MKNEKNKQSSNKILFITIGIVAIIALYFLAIIPLKNHFEKNRFLALSANMQDLYDQLKNIATESEDLVFKNECDEEKSGDWPTGYYYCESSITLDKQVETAGEVSEIQSRYFAVIDSTESLQSSSELALYSPEDFGRNYVVSGAEKKYLNNSIKCKYLNALNNDDGTYNVDMPGDKIDENNGRLILSLQCIDKTTSDWYAE